METIIHREFGRKWSLPKFLVFNDAGNYFGEHEDKYRHRTYTVLGYRSIKAGEWFISGARATAYYMPNDSGQKHLVVQPSEEVYTTTSVTKFVKLKQ